MTEPDFDWPEVRTRAEQIRLAAGVQHTALDHTAMGYLLGLLIAERSVATGHALLSEHTKEGVVLQGKTMLIAIGHLSKQQENKP